MNTINKHCLITNKYIRSVNHELGSYEITKISLPRFDDKRYLLSDGTHSYAYGHYKIKKIDTINLIKYIVFQKLYIFFKIGL